MRDDFKERSNITFSKFITVFKTFFLGTLKKKKYFIIIIFLFSGKAFKIHFVRRSRLYYHIKTTVNVNEENNNSNQMTKITKVTRFQF